MSGSSRTTRIPIREPELWEITYTDGTSHRVEAAYYRQAFYQRDRDKEMVSCTEVPWDTPCATPSR